MGITSNHYLNSLLRLVLPQTPVWRCVHRIRLVGDLVSTSKLFSVTSQKILTHNKQHVMLAFFQSKQCTSGNFIKYQQFINSVTWINDFTSFKNDKSIFILLVVKAIIYANELDIS